MLRVAIKGILARKVRMLLTSIAVVLGVAFVSGAFLLTDSLRSSFDDLFSEATSGLAVEVRTQQYKELSDLQQSGSTLVGLDYQKVGVAEDVLGTVRDVDGVDQAEGTFFELGAQPLKRDGSPIGATGSPTFLANWEPAAESSNVIKIVKGEAPGDGQMMLDQASAKTGEFEIGDDVTVLVDGGRRKETFELSGIVRFGASSSSFFGAITVLPTPVVQDLLGAKGFFSAIDVTSDGSVSDDVLKRRIAKALDDDRYLVVTGKELGAELNEGVDTGFLSLMQNFILVFAAIAVFVGAFVIFNTFTILVGQRQREFGMLRAIGASRRQLLAIVALEAIVVGVLASTLGLFAGYGVASALRSMISAVGVDLPTGPFPIEARTVVWCYSVGVLVTLAACVIPAWRASRMAPLDAVRSATTTGKGGWKVPAFGGVLVAIGVVLVVSGFQAGDGASTSSVLTRIGVGLGLTVLGVALLSRIIIAPVVRVLAPVLAFGTSGRLASRNALRNRARSATTASALMIGLAIASLALVFQASVSATIDKQIKQSIGADIVAYNKLSQTGQTAFVSDDQLEEIGSVDGVREATGQRQGSFQLGKEFDASKPGASEYMVGLDPETVGDDGMVSFDDVDGAERPGDGILVSRDIAKDEGWSIGDDVTLTTADGATATLELEGTFKGNDFTGEWIVSTETFDRIQPQNLHGSGFVLVNVDEGVQPSTVVKRIDKALGKDAKIIDVKDNEALRKQAEDQFGFIIGVVMAMLFLSLVIALFGIANTLALNVFERTREIGLIRAVGGTRRQVKRMIRIEAVLIALFGAIVGVALGVAAGAALVSALADEGFVFGLSAGPLLIVLGGGFLAGLLASILPARRAAKMDVLQAIATE